jgi:hypothetical protein
MWCLAVPLTGSGGGQADPEVLFFPARPQSVVSTLALTQMSDYAQTVYLMVCYGLSVCVFPKFLLTQIPKAMDLKAGVFGR